MAARFGPRRFFFPHLIGQEAIPMKYKFSETLRAAGACLRSAMLALTVALGIVGLVAGPALATVNTITPLQTQPPRVLPEQAMHYLRFTFNFNTCVLRAADTACSIRVGSLPYNAFLVAISSQIITFFNPTTSATIALGTAGQSANIMAAINVFSTGSLVAAYNTSFAGAGELVTGAGITATGGNGGFDVYATYTVGAAGSQGTAGQAVFIIQYIAPNDGSCVQAVPLGGSSPAC
jgi:hypothetical protein